MEVKHAAQLHDYMISMSTEGALQVEALYASKGLVGRLSHMF